MRVKRNSKQFSLLCSQGAQGAHGKRKKFNSPIRSGSDAEDINFHHYPKVLADCAIFSDKVYCNARNETNLKFCLQREAL